jgi:uncharacterized protein
MSQAEPTNENPFLFGKPVQGEHFCNRRDELRRLLALFRSRNSGWLYSPRRYGKTSLIHEAFALAEGESYRTALVDLMVLQAGDDPASVFLAGYGRLLSAMTGSMERALKVVAGLARSFVPAVTVDAEGRPVLSVAPASARGASPDLAEVLDLPEQLAERRGERVVVALDEFQEVARIQGLEVRLRTIMQRHRNVSYLMAGSRSSLLRTMFTSPERPFFQFGEHIPIQRIEDVELVRYVRGRFASSGVPIRDDLVEEIVRAAESHPHFAQYFASVAWNLRTSGRAEDGEFMEALEEEVVSALDTGFRMFFDGLAAAQVRVLVDVARHGGEEVLSEDRRQAGRLGSASTVASALTALAGKEVVARDDGLWRFVNPAFRLWVLRRVAGGGG